MGDPHPRERTNAGLLSRIARGSEWRPLRTASSNVIDAEQTIAVVPKDSRRTTPRRIASSPKLSPTLARRGVETNRTGRCRGDAFGLRWTRVSRGRLELVLLTLFMVVVGGAGRRVRAQRRLSL